MKRKSINRIYLMGAVFLAVFLLSGCVNSEEKQKLEQQRLEQERQAQTEVLRKECETTARNKADEEFNKRAEAIANAKPVVYSKIKKAGQVMSDYENNKRNTEYNEKIGRIPPSDEELNKARSETDYKDFLGSCLEEKGINN